MLVYTKASGGTAVSTYVFFGVIFLCFITKQPSRENIPVGGRGLRAWSGLPRFKFFELLAPLPMPSVQNSSSLPLGA